jgi:enoyl-[acyl-carrier protein] reductase II
MQNTLTNLLNIQKPIIQGGMIWASGYKLAAAVSNAGGLGVIGAGSMYPHVLKEHITKCKKATNKPFAVNVPLLYPNLNEVMQIILAEKVPVVITSAGNPKTWTNIFKQNDQKVIHVVSSSKFAIKAQEAGCNAVVAEGFEAGGHNGREETTTMVLVPLVKSAVEIPVIAAGGIGSGKQMFAAMALGASGVQMGSRFLATTEASCHVNFKQKVTQLQEGDTQLALKQLTPVRLVKNSFYNQVNQAELRGATVAELSEILGRARAKRGMFEGDLENGELEVGQVAASFNAITSAAEVVNSVYNEFLQTSKNPIDFL